MLGKNFIKTRKFRGAKLISNATRALSPVERIENRLGKMCGRKRKRQVKRTTEQEEWRVSGRPEEEEKREKMPLRMADDVGFIATIPKVQKKRDSIHLFLSSFSWGTILALYLFDLSREAQSR